MAYGKQHKARSVFGGDEFMPSDHDVALDRFGHAYRWVFPGPHNRTKEQDPYGFTDHFLWGDAENGASSAYSDRLKQRDSEAWERAFKAINGKSLREVSRDEADAFMTEYFGRPISVCAIATGCNQSTGCPYFILTFKDREGMPTPLPSVQEPAK
jgi:hypothetical protein